MTEILHNLFQMVDDWAGWQYASDPKLKELLDRRGALQEEIICRLGEDMMEALAGLNLELEDIHDEALFRAAMKLGVQIARPGGPYCTSR